MRLPLSVTTLTIAFFAAGADADVYKYVQSDGRVLYTDVALAGEPGNAPARAPMPQDAEGVQPPPTAYRAWLDALARRKHEVTPYTWERTATGFTPAYWERQLTLRRNVEAARARLAAAD